MDAAEYSTVKENLRQASIRNGFDDVGDVFFDVEANSGFQFPRHGRSLGNVLDINRRSSITGSTPGANLQRRNSKTFSTIARFAQLGTKHRLIRSTGDDTGNDVMIPTERLRRGTVHGTSMALTNGSRLPSKRRSDPSANATSGSQDNKLFLLMHLSALERKKASAKKSKTVHKFRMWASICIVLHRKHKRLIQVWNEDTAYHKQMEEIDQSLEAAEQTGVISNKRLNTDYFKADKQMRMSQEGRRTLTKPSDERTQAEIHHSTLALRNVKIIGDYSLKIQQAFAKVGFFESYEAKRFIVKEGGTPENYYVIIYGQIIIVKLDEHRSTAKTLVKLKRGEDFGELGIYHGKPRQGSIITETYTELLRVSAEDFKTIVMGGNRLDPEVDPFLLNQSFLQGWPLPVLKEHPKQFMTSYVQRNTVMEFDSRRSDWLYIVKSGSIKVLKKLVKTIPSVSQRTGRHVEKAHTNGYQAFLVRDTDYSRHARYNGLYIPRALTMESDDDESQDDPLSARSNLSDDIKSAPLLERLEKVLRPSTAFHMTTPNSKRLHRYSKSAVYRRQKTNARTLTSTTDSQINEKDKENVENQDVNGNPAPEKREGRRTIFDDWDAQYRQTEHEETEADKNPLFVTVQTLKKGEVFGLQYIVFDDQPQPSLIVVSNGADCVRISRRLFKQHLQKDPRMVDRLTNQVSPYPTDEQLQDQLITRVNWESYKEISINQNMSRIRERCKRHTKKQRPFQF
ncbi:uncharacterized protein LOC132559946 [Ylistrum balloti]|uniref:uncharacterized protein LOC132559946 n=1 Tax=Ylistrum balloti TaxID=509963 RepID=UPI002905CC5B|nr:uncharacterized protein LOC132559946 [Ylistrum balloti]